MTSSDFNFPSLASKVFTNLESFGQFFILHLVSLHFLYRGFPCPTFSYNLLTILVMASRVLNWSFKKSGKKLPKSEDLNKQTFCIVDSLLFNCVYHWPKHWMLKRSPSGLQVFMATLLLAAETSRFIGDKKLSLFWPVQPFLFDQTKVSKVIVPCAGPRSFTWDYDNSSHNTMIYDICS